MLTNYDDWLFDLDGTLYDHAAFDRLAFMAIESRFGVPGLAAWLERCKQEDPDRGDIFDRAVDHFAIDRQLVPTMIDTYRRFDGEGLRPDDGLGPTLAAARAPHQRLFIVTNGRPAQQAAKVAHLGVCCEAIVACPPNQPETLKPGLWAWNCLQETHRLGNTVMVGDRPQVDGLFAHRAGIAYIHFSYREALDADR